VYMKQLKLDPTHQLYRSIVGKVETIMVWMLPDPKSCLVNQRGCWQVWSNPMVWDNWYPTEKEALQQEILARRKMLSFSKSTLKEQQQTLNKLLAQQRRENKE